MSATQPDRYDDPEPTALVLFAGVVMFLQGTLSTLWGLAAILNDEVVTVGGRGVVVWDFTTWGWIVLLLGVLVAAVGVGLLAHVGIARWLAVVIVAIHAVGYFGVVSAFPLWALFVIALDVLILYQLVARWPAKR